MKKQYKALIALLFILGFSIAVFGQDKPLLEYNESTKKVYLHDENNVHHEVFRDTLNGKPGKYYIIKDNDKWYGVFRRTPEFLRFDYVYGNSINYPITAKN